MSEIHDEVETASGDDTLAVLHEIQHRLASIVSVPEAKEVADQAAALRLYARRAKKGLVVQNHCAWVKLLAERRAGELLLDMDLLRGRPEKASQATRLSDMDITYDQSSRWKRLASVPAEELHAVKKKCDDDNEELTSVRLDQAIKKYMHVPQPDDEFHVEDAIGRARRLLCQSIESLLMPGSTEEVYLDIVLLDRSLHRHEIGQVRDIVFELRRRVNTAIEKLTVRMAIDVDDLDADDEVRRQQERALEARIAELDPSLLHPEP